MEGNDKKGEKECIGRRIIFWYVARIGSKGIDFWRFIRKFDFVSLSETWIDEES